MIPAHQVIEAAPFAREIARAYLSIRDSHTRSLIVRTFGAAGVHAALSRYRLAAEEKESAFYASVRSSDLFFPCLCVTCRVYGGDCYHTLAAQALFEYLSRWTARARKAVRS